MKTPRFALVVAILLSLSYVVPAGANSLAPNGNGNGNGNGHTVKDAATIKREAAAAITEIENNIAALKAEQTTAQNNNNTMAFNYISGLITRAESLLDTAKTTKKTVDTLADGGDLAGAEAELEKLTTAVSQTNSFKTEAMSQNTPGGGNNNNQQGDGDGDDGLTAVGSGVQAPEFGNGNTDPTVSTPAAGQGGSGITQNTGSTGLGNMNSAGSSGGSTLSQVATGDSAANGGGGGSLGGDTGGANTNQIVNNNKTTVDETIEACKAGDPSCKEKAGELVNPNAGSGDQACFSKDSAGKCII
ncbi:MAG: hypothetical protein GMKNLPBB_02517 [Myxococcota bacterium]|nr:hypothetical protein [Myxococcota bacterium]